MSQEPTAAGELSAREIEILQLVATGATNQQIAHTLFISVNTVKAHLRNIFEKLGVESRTGATLYAIQRGLVAVKRPQSGQESLTGHLTSGSGSPAVVRELALPPFHWPLSAVQRLVPVLALLLLLVVSVWPAAQSQGMSKSSRFVDLPQAPSPAAEPDRLLRWQTKAPLATPRSRFAQAESEGIIYVFSGLTDGGWTAEVDAYDPTTDRWERRTPKPTAVANVGAAVVAGRIYVPGGYDQTSAVRDILEVYDPHSDTWESRAPLPSPLCAYAISEVGDGFYLLGGWDGQHYLDSVYRYDAAADTWQKEAPLRVPRGFAAAATVNGRVYLLGGLDGTTEYDLCESYDPALAKAGQNPWRMHTPMRVGRAGHGIVAFQGVIYVVGGGWDSYYAHNERYDVTNDAWSSFESPLTGRWRTLGVSPVTLRDGMYLYTIGGWNGKHLGVVQAYQATYQLFLPYE